MYTHVFFDIGGVLGTNGWSTAQRAAAAEAFALDGGFEARHYAHVEAWETDAITMDEYLDAAVFERPRSFTREAFVAFVVAQSRPFPESIAVAKALRARGGVPMMTLNNESDALNRHRIAHFGLAGLFDAFLSSCWLGAYKPAPAFFARALGISGADPARSLFIDDRELNLAPARALGFDTILHDGASPTAAAALADALGARGLL